MNKCLHIQIFIYSFTHSLTYTTRPHRHRHRHRHIHQTAHIKLSVKQTFIDLTPLESVTKLTFVLHAHRGFFAFFFFFIFSLATLHSTGTSLIVAYCLFFLFKEKGRPSFHPFSTLLRIQSKTQVFPPKKQLATVIRSVESFLKTKKRPHKYMFIA